MKRTKPVMPRAREEELVVEELPDETLVYDLKSHRASCLNRTAALVWSHCDGQTSVAAMATMLQSELETPVDEAVVWMALDRLGRSRLLTEQVTLPADRAEYSRRAVLRTLGRAAGITLFLPVVASIVAPRAEAQATCISMSACVAKRPPCGNMAICASPGTCCKNVGAGNCGSAAC